MVSTIIQNQDDFRQQRLRRPGSVQLASVPSVFQQVIVPGKPLEAIRVGTSLLWVSESPTIFHACSLACGPGLSVFVGVSLWQASPARRVAEQGVSSISLFELTLPMQFIKEAVMNIHTSIGIGIALIMAA
jgi:hypothetical protein